MQSQSQLMYETMNTPIGNYRFRKYDEGSTLYDPTGNGIEVLPEEGKEVEKLVIWMHGLGDSADGWFSAVPQLNRHTAEAGIGVKYILPTAPTIPVTLNMGMRMNAWTDIYSLRSEDKRYDEEGLTQSKDRIINIIDRSLEEYNHLTYQDVIVGGFSQGGAMSYYLGLTYNEPIRSIITLSAFLPARDHMLTLLSDHASSNLGYLHCHGKSDNIVLYDYGVQSIRFVAEEVCDQTFEENRPEFQKVNFYSFRGMGHEISMEEIEIVSRYILHRFQQEER
jgi:predicted esterase